jgi:capsular polysaccharide export protein
MHKSGYFYYVSNIISFFGSKEFEGWGRKKTGNFALWCHRNFGGKMILHEDGFIRSLGLGVDGSVSFSQVEDDVGIYYDATKRSKLENILNTYDFDSDEHLMEQAKEAIRLIKKYHISKYNHSVEMDSEFFKNDTRKKVLIVAQTAADASLKYGKAEKYSTKEMIADAMSENADASIYMKIHPDVLSGKKKSDIDLSDIPEECMVLDADVNPISLLQYMDKIYTKTSGMGMEALILGKEVVCYGLPYYAGWGITQDKQNCDRRSKKLSMEALFAGAYILYTKYYNPFSQKNLIS